MMPSVLRNELWPSLQLDFLAIGPQWGVTRMYELFSHLVVLTISQRGRSNWSIKNIGNGSLLK
jgi:hypothetical protein